MIRSARSFKKYFLSGAIFVVLVTGSIVLYQVMTREDAYAGPPTVKLISQQQYENSVRYLFGNTIQLPSHLPPVQRYKGMLSLGASKVAITPSALEKFYLYGKSVAEQVVDPINRDYLLPCTPRHADSSDAACAEVIISQVGRYLYRRPLNPQDIEKLVQTANQTAAQLDDFYAGISLVLSAMLISPDFILIADTVEKHPDHRGAYRLDSYSIAARLSFFLWNSSPDYELLLAAERGDLHDPEKKKKQVNRMIASENYKQGLRGFFSDILLYEELFNLAKDTTIYPAYGPMTAKESGEQMMKTIIHHLVDLDADYRDLFTTRKTFMTRALGALYKVPVNAVSEFVPYEFPLDDPRAGLLSQVAFLSLHSHPGRSSPTLRGQGLRESLLCQTVPPPPPNIDFSNFEDQAGEFKTARERLVRHSSDPGCANCHKITDPIGLGLENFDGAGQWRMTENGALIDPSGELDGIPFEDVVGLGEAVKKNPATVSCLVERLFAFGVNRPVHPMDRKVLEDYEDYFEDEGFSVPKLMRNIALSDEFIAVDLNTES